MWLTWTLLCGEKTLNSDLYAFTGQLHEATYPHETGKHRKMAYGHDSCTDKKARGIPVEKLNHLLRKGRL